MSNLVLEALDVAGPLQWRWLLRTDQAEPLASHQVDLDPGEFLYRGFADLYGFLRWQADPDERLASEERLTVQVGQWITDQALGPELVDVLLNEAPVTVRVVAPEKLGFVPYRPWELARRDGRGLGREQVRLARIFRGASAVHDRRVLGPRGRENRIGV